MPMLDSGRVPTGRSTKKIKIIFYDSRVCQVCTLCVNFLTEERVILHALCVTQVTEGCVKKRVLQG